MSVGSHTVDVSLIPYVVGNGQTILLPHAHTDIPHTQTTTPVVAHTRPMSTAIPGIQPPHHITNHHILTHLTLIQLTLTQLTLIHLTLIHLAGTTHQKRPHATRIPTNRRSTFPAWVLPWEGKRVIHSTAFIVFLILFFFPFSFHASPIGMLGVK